MIAVVLGSYTRRDRALARPRVELTTADAAPDGVEQPDGTWPTGSVS